MASIKASTAKLQCCSLNSHACLRFGLKCSQESQENCIWMPFGRDAASAHGPQPPALASAPKLSRTLSSLFICHGRFCSKHERKGTRKKHKKKMEINRRASQAAKAFTTGVTDGWNDDGDGSKVNKIKLFKRKCKKKK